MTTEVQGKEYKLIELSIPKKGLLKAGLGLIIVDGAYHVLQGLGFFTPIPGAETMAMAEFVAASQAIAINWLAVAHGALLIFIAIMLWRHLNNN